MGYVPEYREPSVDLDMIASRKHVWASWQLLCTS